MTELFENSLVEFTDEYKNVISIERILWISPERDECVTFNILNEQSMPIWKSLSELLDNISSGSEKKLEIDPYLYSRGIKEPSEYSIKLRDQAWAKIKDIVLDEPDIYDEKLRGKIIEELIEKNKGYHKKVIYKHLRRYWMGGKVINALLPRYDKSGAPGKSRTSKTGIKRGRKPATTLLNPDKIIGINVDEEVKQAFRAAIKLHYHTEKKNPLKHAYEEMLPQFFNIGYEFDSNRELVPVLPPQEQLPTFGQFKYCFYKERNVKETLMKREGKRKFLLRKRSVVGNATRRASGPGAIYEIDATIGDFHLVHSINRRNIGRPIIYYVKDVFSHLVSGVSIGIENISWLGSMLALENTTSEKVSFCAEYGINITDHEWPCRHLPKSITADRGEMESKNVDYLIKNLGVRVDNTPPYRGDFKPFVEQHFRIANTKSKPVIPGVIKNDIPERGERDYRLDAALSIKAFAKIIILLVIEYNNTVLEDYPLDKDMIEAGLVPTPLNLWNWGMKHRYVGLHEKSRDVIRLNLMPSDYATVSHNRGIYFNKWKLGYTCDEAISEGWFEKAREDGSWKVPVSYDPRNSNYIYIRSENGLNYIKCRLLPQYDRFADFCEEEIETQHIVERALSQGEKTRENTLRTSTKQKMGEIIKAEVANTGFMRDPKLSKRELLGRSRENRANEKEREREISNWVLGEDSEVNLSSSTVGEVIYLHNHQNADGTNVQAEDKTEQSDGDIYDILDEHLTRRKSKK